jgi:hypothetical protein
MITILQLPAQSVPSPTNIVASLQPIDLNKFTRREKKALL